MGLFDALKGGSKPAPVTVLHKTEGEAALAVAWAAGDQGLVVGRADGTVEVYEVATGTLKKKVLVHPDGLMSMAGDPQGAMVVTGGADGKACLLDAASLEVIKTIDVNAKAKGAWVEHAEFSPDGSKIAIGAGKWVWIGTVRGGDDLLELGPHQSTVAGLSFRHDGGACAVARYGGADLWAADGDRHELPWKSSLVSIRWQPQGRYIAAGCQDDAVHFWRLDTGTDSMMGGYPAKPRAICWTTDGNQLATAGGQELVVWSFKGKGPEGTSPLILSAHEALITVIAAVKTDQRVVTGARDGKVHVWRLGRSDKPVASLELGDVIHTIATSASGHVAVGAANGALVVAKLP